jgi:hypothetical protein
MLRCYNAVSVSIILALALTRILQHICFRRAITRTLFSWRLERSPQGERLHSSQTRRARTQRKRVATAFPWKLILGTTARSNMIPSLDNIGQVRRGFHHCGRHGRVRLRERARTEVLAASMQFLPKVAPRGDAPCHHAKFVLVSMCMHGYFPQARAIMASCTGSVFSVASISDAAASYNMGDQAVRFCTSRAKLWRSCTRL